MTALLLKGRETSRQLQSDLAMSFAELAAATRVQPTLAALQVGADAAASGYLRAIRRACQGVEATLRPVVLPEESSQGEVKAALTELNEDGSVHGIMVLEPLPDHIDSTQLIDLLSPAKDVDGVHPLNAGRLAAQREPHFVPATPAGAMKLLEEADVDFKGKRAVVIGRSDIVGKPMAPPFAASTLYGNHRTQPYGESTRSCAAGGHFVRGRGPAGDGNRGVGKARSSRRGFRYYLRGGRLEG